MKRFISIFLICILVLSFTACHSKNDDKTNYNNGNSDVSLSDNSDQLTGYSLEEIKSDFEKAMNNQSASEFERYVLPHSQEIINSIINSDDMINEFYSETVDFFEDCYDGDESIYDGDKSIHEFINDYNYTVSDFDEINETEHVRSYTFEELVNSYGYPKFNWEQEFLNSSIGSDISQEDFDYTINLLNQNTTTVYSKYSLKTQIVDYGELTFTMDFGEFKDTYDLRVIKTSNGYLVIGIN
jgi:hypothetical protein